ncbi:MAG: rhamnose transport system permease protein [Clostridiales bacterium]|jgi:rhamnose transport system permease protein|nr:rhamnose transport system permease protein [Clostridiales bacterium]
MSDSKIKQPHSLNISRLRDLGLVLFIVLLSIFIQFRNDQFLTISNLNNMIINACIMGILAVGMMMVIITGGIDLSIGATLALSGMSSAMFVRDNPQASIIFAILIAIGVGMAAGFINGLLVGKGGVLPLIATLGMMNVYRGLTYIIAGGAWVSAYQMNDAFKAIAFVELIGINSLIWIAVFVFVVAYYFLEYTRTGRRIYAVGSNYEASQISGTNVDNIQIMVYTIMGGIAGLSGILWVSRFASAQGDTAQGFEMNVIAACVLGGVSISGGSGKVPGVALGTLLLGILRNALPLLKVSPFWQDAIYGLIIMIAIIVNVMVKRTVDKRNLQRRHI